MKIDETLSMNIIIIILCILAWIWYRAFCGAHKQEVAWFGEKNPQTETGATRTTGNIFWHHITDRMYVICIYEIYMYVDIASKRQIFLGPIWNLTFICEGRAFDWQRYRNWDSFHLKIKYKHTHKQTNKLFYHTQLSNVQRVIWPEGPLILSGHPVGSFWPLFGTSWPRVFKRCCPVVISG